MQKIKDNKSKIIIILSVILVILFTVAGVIIISKRVIKKADNTSQNEEQLDKLKDEEIKDIFYNNYLLTYLLEADVKTGKGSIKIDGETDVYYAVNDPLLEKITSMEDINSLFENTLDEFATIRAKKFMESEYGNHYVAFDGTLYVKKGLGNCSVYKGEKIDITKVSTQIDKDNTYAIYNYVYYRLYPDYNNRLKASSLWFNCAPNMEGTGLDEESVYNPIPDNDEVVELPKD